MPTSHSNNNSGNNKISDLAINFPIPAKPELLQQISHELENPDFDFSIIAELISQDVAISAAILKLVNSAYFGLASKVDSIRQAINYIGLELTINLVRGFLLNQLYEQNGISFPRFWDTAARISQVSRCIASRLFKINPDKAYLTGLFHDTGIPLISSQYSDYKNILSLANQSESGLFTDIEDEQYNINHTTVGGLICIEWGLPDDVSEVIENHHNVDFLLDRISESANEKATLFATLKLAELAETLFREDESNYEWLRFRDPVLNLVKMQEAEVIELLFNILIELDYAIEDK